MSRRKVEEPKETLECMVQVYVSSKGQADVATKVAASYNKLIKAEMIAGKLDEFIAGDIRASITVKENEDFNEQQAIEILRKTLSRKDFGSVVKTREYIDDVALEAMVYNATLDATILSPCTTKKDDTITLRIAKVK